MKIINKVLLILAVSVTICACNTTKKVKEEEFTVNMNSPQVTIGEIELQMETFIDFGKIKKQNVTVLYYPKEDAICLKYKMDFFTYHQFWNRKGRLEFINALQKYNDDYDARNLQSKKSKSQLTYGTIRGYLVWQQFSFSVQARANMDVGLGYSFKSNSPYFTIFQRAAEYIDSMSRDNNKTSIAITLYFTRAQAAELANIFDQYLILTEDMEAKKPEKAKIFDSFKSSKKEEAEKDEY